MEEKYVAGKRILWMKPEEAEKLVCPLMTTSVASSVGNITPNSVDRRCITHGCMLWITLIEDEDGNEVKGTCALRRIGT